MTDPKLPPDMSWSRKLAEDIAISLAHSCIVLQPRHVDKVHAVIVRELGKRKIEP